MKLSQRITLALSALTLLLSCCSCSDGLRAADFQTDAEQISFTNYTASDYQLTLSETDRAYLQDYEKKQENAFLVLYYQAQTGYIAVADKRTGKVWFSVSPELEEDGTVEEETKKLLCSPIQVEYKELQAFKSVNTFTNSVEDGNFSCKDIENGIAVSYTFMDITQAMADQVSADNGKKTTPQKLFDITVEYTLDNESLIVTVPMKKIKYTDNYPPLSIKLLQDFGSSKEKDGYLVVPDGSGALIRFDQEKTNTSPFLSNVYGLDKTLEIKTQPNKVENSPLPVFGLKEKDNAYLAIIEDSEAVSSIGANPAGALSERNEVFSSFQTLAYQKVSIGQATEESKFVAVQDQLYEGNIRVRYAFLQKEDADYVGMASYYRNYLIERYGMEKLQKSESIPLNLELIGSIKKVQSFLGINYDGMESLTTFEQAQEILSELTENQVGPINLKYSGWLKGGLEQDYAGRFSVLGNLGGKKGLQELSEFAEEHQINFYPAVSFLTAAPKAKGFHQLTMSAKQLDQNRAKFYSYDQVSLAGTDYRCILSPNALKKAATKFFEKYDALKLGAVCMEDLAAEVFADYTSGNLFDRQSSVNLYQQLMKEQKKSKKLMINGSYDYAATLADVILNVPDGDSGYNVTDEAIPFYQIVYHGYKDYSAAPLNSAYSIRDDVLKSIEYGALPYFKVMYASGDKTKNTEYSYLCSNNYASWKSDIIAYYQQMNYALAEIRDQVIVDHGKLQAEVYKTTYENGVSVIVNYSDQKVSLDGLEIPAKGFIKVKGAA